MDMETEMGMNNGMEMRMVIKPEMDMGIGDADGYGDADVKEDGY